MAFNNYCCYGMWNNDKINGYGTIIYENGTKYKGDFKNGQREEKGIMELIE